FALRFRIGRNGHDRRARRTVRCCFSLARPTLQRDERMKAVAPPAAKPLSLRGLAKRYASADGRIVEALLPIDLDIASGEFLVVVGPSGCGKSTMLNILAGLTPPSAGEARVGAAIVRGPDIDRGMVVQDYALFPWLAVLGNVEFGLVPKL